MIVYTGQSLYQAADCPDFTGDTICMDEQLPLTGVKIVDLSTYAAVPAAARILADWGANVIKVESFKGDSWRRYGEIAQVPCTEDENPCWDVNNSNKRSISLNLRTEKGMEILHRLLADADVFMTNYRMTALRAMSLTWKVLHQTYPRLIWGHLSGYGNKGPEAERPGFDIAAFWARSGLMQDYGQPGMAPLTPFHAVGDMTTGSIMAGGLCAALYKQARTGKGDKVEISLLGTASWLTGFPAVAAQKAYGNVYPRKRNEQPSPVCIPYECADGEWLELCIMDYERYYPALCHILDLDTLIDDERFNTFAAVQCHAGEFIDLVQRAFLKKKRADWGPVLTAADIVYDNVGHFRDITENQQAWANGNLYERHFNNGRSAVLPNTPITFEEARRPASPAPFLGEHSREILREYGYTDEEIEEYIVSGIVRDHSET